LKGAKTMNLKRSSKWVWMKNPESDQYVSQPDVLVRTIKIKGNDYFLMVSIGDNSPDWLLSIQSEEPQKQVFLEKEVNPDYHKRFNKAVRKAKNCETCEQVYWANGHQWKADNHRFCSAHCMEMWENAHED
jgi:hypothetical protein